MSNPLYTVFEAVNGELQETFIGITSRPLPDTLDELKAAPPKAISHWDFDRVEGVHALRAGISLPAAQGVATAACRTGRRPGWKRLGA
jgi:hypothetical protein